MKLRKCRTLLLFLYGVTCFFNKAFAQPITTAVNSPGTYILTFPPSESDSEYCKKLHSDLEGLQATDITMYEDAGIAIVNAPSSDFLSRSATIEGLTSIQPDRTVQRLRTPNQARSLTVSEQSLTDSNNEEEKTNTHKSHHKSDPLVKLQWGLDAIHARKVHKAGYKGKGVRVAVLDSGFDLDHPDIKKNIDFQASANFVPHESLQYMPPTDGSDPFSFGTAEASTIAARENGVGIVGVAPKATLILLKVVTDQTLEGQVSWLIQGIIKAVREGADVINMDLLGSEYAVGDPDLARDLKALTQVFTYAHNRGAVIVTASGFSGLNLDKDPTVVLPAAAPYAIAVSATAPLGLRQDPKRRSLDNIASYSNIGKNIVDLAAPGGDFAYPNTEEITYGGITAPLNEFDGIIAANYDKTWAFFGGIVTAHVSGIAALIISQHHGKICPSEVEQILLESADDLGKLGFDASYGNGRVNAYNAVIGDKQHKKSNKSHGRSHSEHEKSHKSHEKPKKSHERPHKTRVRPNKSHEKPRETKH